MIRTSLREELAGKFVKERGESFYRRWVRKQGLEVISAHYVEDLNTVELKPWSKVGGRGIFINHELSDFSNDCQVLEIPPAGSTNPQRHLYEEMIYVLKGRGSTAVWNHKGKKMSFEWGEGSIFAIPLNTWYQHFNASGSNPVRLVAVTNAPLVLNLFEDEEFVFNTKYDFESRFAGEEDYFEPKEEVTGFFLETNFIHDARTLRLVSAKERGGEGAHIRFKLARGTMSAHISEFPVGVYKKAHRHGPGAHVIILSGEGYSLMWPEGEKMRRYNWRPGTLIVPPDRWWHQHFNVGREPARYLAFKYEGTIYSRTEEGIPKSWISRREGGDQIDYADEDPMVRRMFEEELAKRGIRSRMDPIYEEELRRLSAKG